MNVGEGDTAPLIWSLLQRLSRRPKRPATHPALMCYHSVQTLCMRERSVQFQQTFSAVVLDHIPTPSMAEAEGQSGELSGALVASLRSVVSKPDVYLIKAAQAST